MRVLEKSEGTVKSQDLIAARDAAMKALEELGQRQGSGGSPPLWERVAARSADDKHARIALQNLGMH